MKKILILANNDVGLYNFRKELLQRLIKNGYEVIISSPYGERIENLKQMGCIYDTISMDRHGMNPISEIKLWAYYKRLVSKINPSIILTYTVKPTIYGAIVARLANIPCIVNITGLGIALENEGITQSLLVKMYRNALKKVNCVFFQNVENKKFFEKNHMLNSKYKLIPGSGVNINEFSYYEYPQYAHKHDKFLFVGRVMKSKGIEEYLEVAKKIKKQCPGVEFGIAGFIDGDYEERLQKLQSDNTINYYGMQTNMHKLYHTCSAVILPSYHEGMANVLLEASSIGRPVLTSNISGCKETFDEGITGFGFEAKSAESLYVTVNRFMALTYEEKKSMGEAAREKMIREFNREIVVNEYMKEISILEER